MMIGPSPPAVRDPLAAKLDHVLRARAVAHPVVLDAGCGDGRTTRLIAQALAARHATAFRLVGLDVGIAAVVDARRHLGRSAWRENVRCLRGDLYRLPFRDGSFDYVISANVFHGIRRTLFMSEARRVLKTAGVFFTYDRIPELLPFPRMTLTLTREQLTVLLAARRGAGECYPARSVSIGLTRLARRAGT